MCLHEKRIGNITRQRKMISIDSHLIFTAPCFRADGYIDSCFNLAYMGMTGARRGEVGREEKLERKQGKGSACS